MRGEEMRFAVRRWVLVALVCLGFSGAASAVPIVYGFSGNISSVTDADNFLDGSVIVGGAFSGSFSYDSSEPDVIFDSDQYSCGGCSGTVSSSATTGNYLFQGIPTGTADLLNRPIGGTDVLAFLIPYASDPFIDLGATPGRAIFLRFFDDSGTVFSSDTLPSSIDLNDFSSSTITLPGDIGLAPGFSVVGNISSLELTSVPVPEPTALVLMALGLAALRFSRRRKT